MKLPRRTYSADRAWSDQFLPQLRAIIGPYLLVPSSLQQDRTEACDLTILRARDMTVACRVRQSRYAHDYPRQFTIRSRRDNGAKTELSKIIEGWGDWFFYGFGSDGGQVQPWYLIDLSIFRAHLIRSKKRIQFGEQPNGDGTYFYWFKIDTFPPKPPLLIAESAASDEPHQSDLLAEEIFK